MAVIWTAIVVPLDLAFDEETEGTRTVDLFIDSVFIFALGLAFFTGYYDDEGEIIMSMPAIAHNYLTSWFVLDLVAAVPVAFVEEVMEADDKKISDTVRKILLALTMVKIVRIIRLGRLAKQLLQFRFAGHIRVLRMILILLLFIPWFGFAWYGLEK